MTYSELHGKPLKTLEQVYEFETEDETSDDVPLLIMIASDEFEIEIAEETSEDEEDEEDKIVYDCDFFDRHPGCFEQMYQIETRCHADIYDADEGFRHAVKVYEYINGPYIPWDDLD